MSFVGFLRLHQAALFSVLVVITLSWSLFSIIAGKFRKKDPELAQFLLRVRFYLVVVIVVISAIGLANSAMSNLTPQSVIDRTEINSQQNQRERDVQQRQHEAEASKKEKN